MGGTKKYLESGGFTEQTYKQIGTTANGIKIIERNDGSRNTPAFSNTPNTMYAKLDDKGRVSQIAVYGGNGGRQKIKDIDIGHTHTNLDGTVFNKNQAHVQEYGGTTRFSNNARKPSRKEKRLIMMARNGRSFDNG